MGTLTNSGLGGTLNVNSYNVGRLVLCSKPGEVVWHFYLPKVEKCWEILPKCKTSVVFSRTTAYIQSLGPLALGDIVAFFFSFSFKTSFVA